MAKHTAIRNKEEALKKIAKYGVTTVNGSKYNLDDYHKTTVAKNIIDKLFAEDRLQKTPIARWFEMKFTVKKLEEAK